MLTSTLDFWDSDSPAPGLRTTGNPEMGFLNAGLPENSRNFFGLPAPHDWPSLPANQGTHILAHAFSEPISAEHVKVVKMFVKEPKVIRAWYTPGIGHDKYNRDVFREFWEDKKRQNSMPGFDLADVPSPYAWMDKPREEDMYVKNFQDFEAFLKFPVLCLQLSGML